jgi:RNA binding exosome subunit
MEASAFHWVRVKAICNATEDTVLISSTMTNMTGTEEFTTDSTEGINGSPMTVIDAELTRNKEFDAMFSALGPGIAAQLVNELDWRVDDDCTLYFRIDKQKAVKGVYEIAHGGDVISITCKVASHPAKKETAVKNAKAYLMRFAQPLPDPSSQ